jgi:serine/threonine protein kinase
MPSATHSLGQKFTVRSHIPPPPTPVSYKCCINETPEQEEQNRRGALQTCLDHPPLPGRDGSFLVELELVGLLRVEDNSNPPFLVQVCGATPEAPHELDPGKRFIAKVFDPLFVNTQDGEVNPIRLMDKHYTHEVATYRILWEFQGTKIPKFYGSFSWSIPVPGQEGIFRKVRLILLEHLPGISMQEADAEDFSTQTRQNMMKKIIDLETCIYARGVRLRDLSPRNVIMTDPNNPTELFFLDFGDATFPNITKDISPLSRWADGRLIWEFGSHGWIDWHVEPWVKFEWAETITLESQKIYHEHQYLAPQRQLQDISNLSYVEPHTKSTQMPL